MFFFSSKIADVQACNDCNNCLTIAFHRTHCAVGLHTLTFNFAATDILHHVVPSALD